MKDYQYQIFLEDEGSGHKADLKGKLEELMKTMGMDMDTLVCFPSSIKDVRPEMPALVVYFASFQTDDDAWLGDAKKMHIPVLPVFDTRTGVEPQLSQSFDLFQFFRLTKADDYAELAKQILTSLQLSERKKAFLIYQPSEPNPLRMELFDELVRRGYSVTMDAYKELPDEEQMKRLAESEILIFFYDREILKKQGMREMLADASRMQVGIIEIVEEEEELEYEIPAKKISLRSCYLWNSCKRKTARQIVDDVEQWRAVNMQRRIDNLINPIERYLKEHHYSWDILPSWRFLWKATGKICSYVPVTGVPEWNDLQDIKKWADEYRETKNIYAVDAQMVYDSLCANPAMAQQIDRWGHDHSVKVIQGNKTHEKHNEP